MTTLCSRLALVNLLFAANIYQAVTLSKYSRLKRDNEPCEPFMPVTLNSSYPSLRISERRCLEYVITVENNIREEKWNETCDQYTGMKTNNNPRVETMPSIIGGQSAVTNEFPHMGAVGWRAKDPSVKWLFKCGSSLISEMFLLTAAHCSELPIRDDSDVIQTQPEIVRLGDTDISNKKFLVQRRFTDMMIKRIILHPKYASPKQYYDIALIELHEEVKFIKNLHPACVWLEHDFSKLGTKVVLTGWGYTEHGKISEKLQVATIPVLETSECEQLLIRHRSRKWHGFEKHQICAGELAGGVDTCQGDSGGPIQIKMPLKWTEGKTHWILGVTSFGFNCGRVNSPGVYTRVSSFIDWIEEVVWESTK